MAEVKARLHSIITADGGAVLDVECNRITSLNATGSYVWERLERGLAVDRIIQELVQDTGADLAIVEQDVCAFVQQLDKHGFLQH